VDKWNGWLKSGGKMRSNLFIAYLKQLKPVSCVFMGSEELLVSTIVEK